MSFGSGSFSGSAFASDTQQAVERVIASAGIVTRYGSIVGATPIDVLLTGHVVTQHGSLSSTNEFVPVDLSGRITALQATRYGAITGKVDPIIQSAGIVTKYGALSAGFGFVGQIAGVRGTQYGAIAAEMGNTFPVQGTLVTKYGSLHAAFDQHGAIQGAMVTRYGRLAGPDRLPQGHNVIVVQKRQQQITVKASL